MKTKKRISTRKWILSGIIAYSSLAFAITAFADKKKNQQQSGDFAKGAAIWADTCIRCHNMRDPGELNDKQWDIAVAHMRVRSGLTGQDARDVLEFLKRSNGK